MSTTDHTPAPTAEEVAAAVDWLSRSFRTDDLDRHYRETAERVEVLRAGLAAAPAEDAARIETVTEYRLSASKPSGRPYESTTTSASVASNFVTVCRKNGWTGVRVESRTVSTSRRESEWKATDQ